MNYLREIWRSFVEDVPKEERWGMYTGIPMIAVGSFMVGAMSQYDSLPIPDWGFYPLIGLILIGIGVMLFSSEAPKHIDNTDEDGTSDTDAE